MPLKLVKRPNLSARAKEIEKAEQEFLEDVADDFIAALEVMTADWSLKPKFRKVNKKRTIQVQVVDDEAGQRFRWVNYGTGERGGGVAYDIPKSGTKPLRVILNYVPHTTPAGGFGGPGKAGGPVIFRRKVKGHKGIKPRRFNRTARVLVVEKRGKEFRPRMAKAIFALKSNT